MARACFGPRSWLLLAAFGGSGCYDVHTVDPGHAMVPLVADASGWVGANNNPFGLAGGWYSYGDQYPALPRCTDFGFHDADKGEHEDGECSFVGWPDASQPPASSTGRFPNSANRMCTYGSTAKVVKCKPGNEAWCPNDLPDYPNMWGAGIGLEFDLSNDGMAAADAAVPTGWDAEANGIVGVAFDLEWNDPSVQPGPFLRVEFPVVLPPEGRLLPADTVALDETMTTWTVWNAGETLPEGSSSGEHPFGSPFADAPPVWATTAYDLSGVAVGHNEILWPRVRGAPSKGTDYSYAFHPENLLGVLFHVPAIKDTRIPFGFCISNLALLRQ